MLGETVRSTRIKRGLTQARLARLADVSRRHLAALEKGANVSINVLQKVAAVLDLSEINLGELTVQTPHSASNAVNIPLLADTIREAHADAFRAQSLLARAETILDSNGDGLAMSGGLVAHFPTLRPLRIDLRRRRGAMGAVAY
jgi:transcriptional regulator with XRE-family HTH domain